MSGPAGDHKLAPTVLWAQRKDKLFLTIEVSDDLKREAKIDEKSLHFSAKGGKEDKEFEVTLNFLHEVVPEDSKQNLEGRVVTFSVKKKETGPFWTRLVEATKKPHWLKIDFNKWVDEDDSDVDEAKDMQFEDMMSQMGNFNTGPPEGEDDESEDSDDEPMPDLE